MLATRPISKGAEIFNDYGPLPRSDLLRRYGYLTDNYAKYDVVELPTSMIVEEASRYPSWDADEQHRRVRISSLQPYNVSGSIAHQDSLNYYESMTFGKTAATISVFQLSRLLLSPMSY